MKRMFAALILVALLTGCIKHVRHEIVIGPNGREAISMRCGDMSKCLKAAGEFCPNGYVNLNQSTNTVGGTGWTGRQTKTRGIMMIQCK